MAGFKNAALPKAMRVRQQSDTDENYINEATSSLLQDSLLLKRDSHQSGSFRTDYEKAQHLIEFGKFIGQPNRKNRRCKHGI